MNRSFSRNLVIAATLVAMTFIVIPTAHAEPAKASPAFKSRVSLFHAPLLWLGKLPARTIEQLDQIARQNRRDNTWGGPTMTAHTGACIDPDGNRVPCPGV